MSILWLEIRGLKGPSPGTRAEDPSNAKRSAKPVGLCPGRDLDHRCPGLGYRTFPLIMTYIKRVWHAASSREGVTPTAKDMGNIDTALFDQDARVAALETLTADLLARVIVLETP
jgi:hypothetical protein